VELSYIGMIEPGYYNNIYDDAGNTVTDVISWHGHFLVWGTTQRQLQKWRSENRHRLTAIMPYMCAVHFKKVASDDLGRVAAYIVKAPRKEYSVGRRREPDRKIPESLFEQYKRKLRPGHRVKLFKLMRDMTLDQLALSGGDGRHLLAKIKYDARRDFRNKYGRNSRRP
jgi:hypothetical protein